MRQLFFGGVGMFCSYVSASLFLSPSLCMSLSLSLYVSLSLFLTHRLSFAHSFLTLEGGGRAYQLVGVTPGRLLHVIRIVRDVAVTRSRRLV